MRRVGLAEGLLAGGVTLGLSAAALMYGFEALFDSLGDAGEYVRDAGIHNNLSHEWVTAERARLIAQSVIPLLLIRLLAGSVVRTGFRIFLNAPK